jgi:hypothetical protein
MKAATSLNAPTKTMPSSTLPTTPVGPAKPPVTLIKCVEILEMGDLVTVFAPPMEGAKIPPDVFPKQTPSLTILPTSHVAFAKLLAMKNMLAEMDRAPPSMRYAVSTMKEENRHCAHQRIQTFLQTETLLVEPVKVLRVSAKWRIINAVRLGTGSFIAIRFAETAELSVLARIVAFSEEGTLPAALAKGTEVMMWMEEMESTAEAPLMQGRVLQTTSAMRTSIRFA